MKIFYKLITLLFVFCSTLGCESGNHPTDTVEANSPAPNSPIMPAYDNTIAAKVNSQTVWKTEGYPASGFISEGKYLMSAYHPFAKEGLGDPYKVTVFYQINDRWDTVNAQFDRNFIYQNFEMKSHKLEIQNLATDFIVLPLSKPIPEYKMEVELGKSQLNEIFYVGGPPPGFSTGSMANRPLVQLIQKMLITDEDNNATYLGLLGRASHGFSGAPIYNSRGKIVAIMNAGATYADNVNTLSSLRGSVDEKTYNEIHQTLKEGHSLSFCLRMETIMQRYFVTSKK